MENEQKFDVTTEVLKEPLAVGNVFAQSGMFPDIKTAAQAAVKILAGKELGLTPFQSMKSLYMVNGRLGMMADVMAYLLKKNGKYDYHVEKLDEKECVIAFFYLNGEKKEIGKSTFTFSDATKAGLVNKDVWKTYPRNLLFARALSNGVRWYCPDAISAGLYTTEELESIQVEPTKTTIEITPEGQVENGKA